MRGYDRYNFPAFDDAKDRLIEAGWDVVSPADIDRELGITGYTTELPEGFIYDALRRDFAAILTCDAIVFLPGWLQSSGAVAERFVGQQINLEMWHISSSGDIYKEEDEVAA